tara:strand:+ start:1526 stop:1828 length:303 start_codon:yes stop_codon:yes gene_type:complete
MIKQTTIKLGVTTPTSKQYESARADIETTYTLSDEVALDLDKAMDTHKYELRRARIMLKDALRTVKDELAGKLPDGVGKGLKASEAEQLKKLLKDYEAGD